MTSTSKAALAAGVAACVAVAIVGMLRVGGEAATTWKPIGKVDSGFKTVRVLLTGAETGLLVGYIPGTAGAAGHDDPRFSDRTTVLLSADGGRTLAPALDTPGAAVAADLLDARVAWLAVARPRTDQPEGSVYALFRSANGGTSWSEAGAIPAGSVRQLVVTGPDSGWALGAGALVHTADGGATWSPVEAPGRRDPFKERLCDAGGGAIALAGDGLQISRDQGKTWDRTPWPGGRVHLLEGDRVVVDQGKPAVFFGRLKGSRIERGAELPGAFVADQLAAAGETVRIVGVSFGKGGMDLEHLLLTSHDGGAAFRREVLPVTSSDAVGLFGDVAGWLITLDRRLLATR
ncbi:MAG: hypothetical protein HZA54_19655 [Planctomycetes bacterium]|nr:hypothetical protein [Planctomycetota bacterium]